VERRPLSIVRLGIWAMVVAGVGGLEYYARFTSSSGRPATRNEVYSYSAFGNGVFFYAFVLAIVLGIAYERGDLLALRAPPRSAIGLALGVLVAVYACEVLVTLLPIRDPGSEQGLTPAHWEPRHAGAFAANVVLFAVVAPFVEELTFRGVGQSLLQAFGRWPSILLVGIAFGVWHGLVEAELVLVPFGVGLAYLRDRTRSVVPGMVVHALFNGAALAFSVLG
jgi:membrane protease YdiL (CAAX protease family)